MLIYHLRVKLSEWYIITITAMVKIICNAVGRATDWAGMSLN